MAPKREAKTSGETNRAPLQFSAINGILVVAGILTVALCYYLLSQGSITAAPLLLVLGYVIFLPLAIIL